MSKDKTEWSVTLFSFTDNLYLGRLGKTKFWDFDDQSTWLQKQPTEEFDFEDDEEEDEFIFDEESGTYYSRHQSMARMPKYSTSEESLLKPQEEDFTAAQCKKVIEEIEEMFNTKYGKKKETDADRIVKRLAQPKEDPLRKRLVIKDIDISLFNEDGVFKTIYNPKQKSDKV